MKRGLGIDVLSAARRRIVLALDAADRAYVSFSGGKDSTVLLHLVMEEAQRRGRRVGVLFVDLEAQYARTIEHVERCFDLYRDYIDPYWVALSLNLRNAVSQYEPQWRCWERGREKDWVRTPPDRAISTEDAFPFFKPRMEFEEFVPAFADWYSQGRSTACFVGIRSQESLNRWRTIASATKARVNKWCWSTRINGTAAWNAYPIYDWRTEDVWTYHARYPDKPQNSVYDLMHRAGLTIHQARLCQPYGDDQRKGLWLFHALEPETWAKIVARVNGANQGALYAGERGNILGVNKITRPEGHTWESFAELLLDSMPEAHAEHYRNKIAVFLRWWEIRGYDSIPDEAEPENEAKRRAPSWRRICKALLRNDYWCKGLSFSQQDSKESSYARYQAIMKRRREQGWGGGKSWSQECGPDEPGKPTAKQLAMLAALTGGCTPHQAWKALGRHFNISATAARRRITRQGASKAIDELRKSKSEFQAERFRNAPEEQKGEHVHGLPGEG